MAQAAEKYLTMAELAARLNLPESTLRYYCKRFAEWLPGSGEGRKRRYAPEAAPVLGFIVASMQRHKNAMTVELLLKEGQSKTPENGKSRAELLAPEAQKAPGHLCPPAGPQTDLNPVMLRFMERQSEALGQIAAALEILARHSLNNSPGNSATAKGRKARIRGTEALPPALGAMPVANGADDAPATETEALRQEVQNLRRQLQDAEKLHQQDLEQLRKWLGRLGEAVATK